MYLQTQCHMTCDVDAGAASGRVQSRSNRTAQLEGVRVGGLKSVRRSFCHVGNAENDDDEWQRRWRFVFKMWGKQELSGFVA